MAKATQKQVAVIARYAHKNEDTGELTGVVTYLVRASNGVDAYCTTLINGEASGCSCPSRSKKGCYHKTQLVALEVVRAEKAAEVVRHNAEVAQQFGAQVAPSWFVEMVDAGTIVAPKQVVETVAQDVDSPKIVEVAPAVKSAPLVFESVKIGKVLLSDKSYRRRGGTLKQVEQAESLAAMADEIYEIKKRKAAEAPLNGNKAFAIV